MKANQIKQKELRPHTVEGVLARMFQRVLKPRSKTGFLDKNTCHSVSIDYIIRQGKGEDYLVMLGSGNTVTHSIVTDANNQILADSFWHQEPYYDGKQYVTRRMEIKTIQKIKVSEIKKELKQHNNEIKSNKKE